jgi:hypothetical protein
MSHHHPEEHSHHEPAHREPAHHEPAHREHPEHGKTGELPLSHHEIAVRAYEKYLERGKQDGHAVEDWYAAENELRAEQHRHT